MQLFNVGWFPMRRDGQHVFCDSTYAVHMHQYRCTLWIGDQHLNIRPGDITVTPPYVVSRYELLEDGQHWCAHMSVSPSAKGKLSLPLWLETGAHTPALIHRLAWLAELSRMRGGESADLVREGLESGIRDLLLWMHFQQNETRHSHGARAPQVLAAIVGKLEKEYGLDWSAKELAASYEMNANYLAQVFRRAYGCTIDYFLRRRRIEVAQHLLLSTALRVKEVARSVGIADAQKFNKDFRSIAGCSPSEFRLRFKFS